MKTAPPIRITRSERTKGRLAPAGAGLAGARLTAFSCTQGSSQRMASGVPSGGEGDDPVVVRVAAVHHAGAPGLLVHEQVEVVAHEFHLEQRVVDGHRLRVVFLLADDVPRLVVVPVGRRFGEVAVPWLGDGLVERVALVHGYQPGRRRGDGDRSAPAPVYPAAVGATPQPRVELADRAIEGAVEVSGTGFRADHRPTGRTGDLDALAVIGLARVPLVE